MTLHWVHRVEEAGQVARTDRRRVHPAETTSEPGQGSATGHRRAKRNRVPPCLSAGHATLLAHQLFTAPRGRQGPRRRGGRLVRLINPRAPAGRCLCKRLLSRQAPPPGSGSVESSRVDLSVRGRYRRKPLHRTAETLAGWPAGSVASWKEAALIAALTAADLWAAPVPRPASSSSWSPEDWTSGRGATHPFGSDL